MVPVVADANVLIRDVCANLRRPNVTALLGQAELGLIRVLVSARVASEVPSRMPRVAKEDTTLALELWRQRYLPLIRVVELDEAEPESAAIAEMLARVADDDPDDVPTAHLALLCAPCLVVTADRDLLDHGFGAPQWLDGVRASGDISAIDRSLWLTMQLSGVVVEQAARLTLAAGRLLGRSPLALGAALAAAFVAATDGRPLVAAASAATKARGARAIASASDLALALSARRAAGMVALADHVLPPLADPPLAARLASRLGRAPHPVPVATVASAEPTIAQSALRQALRRHPAFVSVHGRGWQLGSTDHRAAT
jgi:hypothetical protein